MPPYNHFTVKARSDDELAAVVHGFLGVIDIVHSAGADHDLRHFLSHALDALAAGCGTESHLRHWNAACH